MHFEDILFEARAGLHGDIGLITLNRQASLNALTQSMFVALDDHLRRWAVEPTIKAVMISAVEGKAFSAGGDIRNVYEKKKANDPKLEDFFRFEYAVNRFIHHFPKPYIALMNGITMGGGVGVSIHGTLRIATKRMTFAMPETTIGFFPDVGATYFLSRLPNNIGMYLGLTGSSINAFDAKRLGLVDIVIDDAAQEAIINVLCQTDFSLSSYRQLLAEQFSFAEGVSQLSDHIATIDEVFAKASVEEIMQSLDSEHPWSSDVIDLLKRKSPTSLKVTFEALRRGKALSFDACMDMEYGLMQHFLGSHDFFEGIRALLIDKDRNPRWIPKHLTDVTDEAVASYFAGK